MRDGHVASAPGRLRVFLAQTAFDLILTACIAVSAAFAASFGFTAASGLRGNAFALAALVLPVLACLFGCTWSRRAVVPGIVAAALACAAEVALLGAVGGAPLFVTDAIGNVSVNGAEGNYGVLALVCCASAALSFLLTRRRWGVCLGLAAFALLCGSVQFLWPRGWSAEGGAFAAFAIGLAALAMRLAYGEYLRCLHDAAHAGAPRFGAATAFSAPVAAGGIAVGFALFLAVIAGSGLTTVEFRPFTRTYAAPTQQQSDEYQRQQTSSDQTTSNTDDRQRDANQPSSGAASSGIAGGAAAFGQSVQQLMVKMDPQSYDKQLQPFPYHFFRLLPLIVAALVVLAAVGAVLWHRGSRERLLRKLSERDPAYRVWALYGFLLERYRRLGLGRRASSTPMEYAVAMRGRMQPFAAAAECGKDPVDFIRVSLAYQDAVIGHLPVDDAAYDDIVRYYRGFFGAAREHVGRLRWLWYFWRM